MILHSVDKIAEWTPDANNIAQLTSFEALKARSNASKSFNDSLLEQLRALELDWKICLSPDSQTLLVLLDDYVLLWNQLDQSTREVFLGEDEHPSLRHVCWSFDSMFAAVSQSNGRINIIDNGTATICYSVMPSTKISRVTWMLIINPQLQAANKFDGVNYQYELLVGTFDCQVTSYLFQNVEADFISVTKIEADHSLAGHPITQHHTFFVDIYLRRVTCASFVSESRLLLGGVSEDSLPVIVLKLLATPPFYQLLGKIEQSQKSSLVANSQYKRFMYFLQKTYIKPEIQQNKFVCGFSLHPNGKRVLITLSDGSLTMIDFERKLEFAIHDLVAQQWKAEDFKTGQMVQQACWWNSQTIVFRFEDGTMDMRMLSEQRSLLEFEQQFSPYSQFNMDQKQNQLVILECRKQHAICSVRNIDGIINVQVSDIGQESAKDNSIPATWFGSAIARLKSMLKPLSYVVNAMTGVHLIDNVHTDFQQFSVPLRSFELKILNESSPQNLLMGQLNSHQFIEALETAKKYSLSRDQVYKFWWLNSEVSADTIENVLVLVTDKQFQIEQTLKPVCTDFSLQLKLYKHGLSVTDIYSELTENQHGSTEVECLQNVILSDVQKSVIHSRVLILLLSRRLELFSKIAEVDQGQYLLREGRSFKSVFAEFRRLKLSEIGLWFASRQAFKALRVIFSSQSVIEINEEELIQVFNAIPETVGASVHIEYYKLYKTASDNARFAKQDWSLLPVILKQIKLDSFDIQHEKSFDQWLQQRYLVVNQVTGSLKCSLQLADLTQSLRLKSIEKFIFDPLFSSLCPTLELPEEFVKASLSQLVSMTTQEYVHFMLKRGLFVWMSHRSAEVFVCDVMVHVLPFLQSNVGPLQDEIKQVSSSDLQLLLHLLQRLSDDNRFEQLGYLVDCAADCCLNCGSDSQYHTIQNIYDLLNSENLRRSVSRQKLYDLENMLAVASELDSFGITLKPEVLLKLSSDISAQKRILTRMARLPLVSSRDAKQRDQLLTNVDGIRELLDSMLHIKSISCPSLSEVDVEELLIASLLGSESEVLISIAQQLLFPSRRKRANATEDYYQLQLTHTQIKDVICKVAMNYLDNAESGNLQDGLLRKSILVLSIIPQSLKLLRPFDELKSLERYVEVVGDICQSLTIPNSSPLLPIEVKLQRDVVQLLEKFVQYNQTAYSHPELLQDYNQVLAERHNDVQSCISLMDLQRLVYIGALANGDVKLANQQLNKLEEMCDKQLYNKLKFQMLTCKSLNEELKALTAFQLLQSCDQESEDPSATDIAIHLRTLNVMRVQDGKSYAEFYFISPNELVNLPDKEWSTIVQSK